MLNRKFLGPIGTGDIFEGNAAETELTTNLEKEARLKINKTVQHALQRGEAIDVGKFKTPEPFYQVKGLLDKGGLTKLGSKYLTNKEKTLAEDYARKKETMDRTQVTPKWRWYHTVDSEDKGYNSIVKRYRRDYNSYLKRKGARKTPKPESQYNSKNREQHLQFVDEMKSHVDPRHFKTMAKTEEQENGRLAAALADEKPSAVQERIINRMLTTLRRRREAQAHNEAIKQVNTRLEKKKVTHLPDAEVEAMDCETEEKGETATAQSLAQGGAGATGGARPKTSVSSAQKSDNG